MTITIPVWVLWALGIGGGLVAIALMALGVMALLVFPKIEIWR